MATGDEISTPMLAGEPCKTVVSQYSDSVGHQTAVQIRHTTEVDSSDAVYAQVKSDLEKAGRTLVQLLRIHNTDLLERFRLESEQLKKLKQKDKDFQLNIQNLYHGTTAPFGQICDEGLDERLSRRGRFGRGIYLSDNPKKCCEYAESRSHKPYLLRCQVILGDIKEFPPGQQDETLTREPMKCVLEGKRVYYDSVKGHPANHTEYVIYDKRRILLEYIAFYSCPSLERSSRRHRTRSCQSDPSSSPLEGAAAFGSYTGSPDRKSLSRSSSSDSESGSIDGSRDGSPVGFSREFGVTRVEPRKTREEVLPSSGSTASACQRSLSSVGQAGISKSAQEQQRLAFKQMLELKSKISESDLNDLIESWTATYGSNPVENPPGGGSYAVPLDAGVDDDDDDPVLEVKKKLVMDFKDITCCSDDDLCIQFIEQYNMDLNAAVEAFICGNAN